VMRSVCHDERKGGKTLCNNALRPKSFTKHTASSMIA
jgi:hypothetical protein